MRVLILALIAGSVATAGAAAGTDTDAAVRDAITAAVRARMGDAVEVEVGEVHVRGDWTAGSVHARLVPGTRLGRPVRVALGGAAARTGGAVAWTGSAEATVQVRVEHLHATRPIARGEVIGAADVTTVRHAVEGALRPWPAAAAAGRSRALRDLPAGACLSPGTIASLPLVRAGQEVQASVLVGRVRAEATLLAADNGELGAIIRVVNPQSRRSLKARVTGPAIVEVIP